MSEEKKPAKKSKTTVKVSTKSDDLLSRYQTHESDTGSTEVQVVVLTKKIAELTKHLKGHKHDFDSRVGLLKMVGKRRRLLNYLKQSDEQKYTDLIADLKLRK
jgi:small subunit ribosomal protein S15